jgi:GTP-binding protein
MTKSKNRADFMNIPPVTIQYLRSVLELRDAPPDIGYEVAFAGRSNAGKSSAINALANIKKLARVSKTPGRTRHINFFRVDAERRLVDLPGYGYAKVSGETQQRWQEALERYLHARRSLRGLFLIMDIRHPFSRMDEMMIEWCARRNLALHLALTKSDKLSRGRALNVLRETNVRLARFELLRFSVQIFSAIDKTGIEEAWDVLRTWLALPLEPISEKKDSGATKGGTLRSA